MDTIDPLDDIHNPKDLTVEKENWQREGFYSYDRLPIEMPYTARRLRLK